MANTLFFCSVQVVYFSHRFSKSRSFFTLPLARTALIHRFTTTLDIHTASWRRSTPSLIPSITPLGVEMEGFFTSCMAPTAIVFYLKAVEESKHFIYQSISNLARGPPSHPCSKSGIWESPWRKSSARENQDWEIWGGVV